MTQAREDRRLMAILFTDEDVSATAAQVRAPTLILHGDRDQTIPLPYGVRLASLIPGARLEVLKGAGHHETTTDPRAVKLVDEFLAEGGPSAASP